MGTAGFAPVNPKSPNPLPVLGEVKRTDASAYDGDSHSTTTYKITQAQAEKMMDFRQKPEAYGFSLTYWAGTNSCVDYVWKGLSTIGMNPGGNEGALRPMDNIGSFKTLRNPAFADGGLVQTVRLVDTIDNRPFAPDGVSRLNDQQVIQAGPNQKILFIWTKDDNGNYQKVENILTLQANGVWKSTAMIVGQYNSDGSPVKATQYTLDSNGNTTSTKALVPTAGGSWVDAPKGTPTSPAEQIAGETVRYQTTTLSGSGSAGSFSATEITNTQTGQVEYVIRSTATGEAVASGSNYVVNANDTASVNDFQWRQAA